MPDDLFPDHPAIQPRGPLPKQRQVFEIIERGDATGGGVVFQGGYGSAKTSCLVAVDVWVHHRWVGTQSLIGRESYPALCTSTWKEYELLLNRLPRRMIANYSRPAKNAMGHVDWAVGGTTLFCSLSDSETWASANLGFVGVDEGHLQNPEVLEKLAPRLRQFEGPRVMVIVTNPAGRNYAWRMANPKSGKKLPHWFWIQASMLENPALSTDYVEMMLARYPEGTVGRKRWIHGDSAALEGTVFSELFDADPKAMMHVIPAFEIPRDWQRGRGLDSGIDNPTVVVWAARSGDDDWYVYRRYGASGRNASSNASYILELEEEEKADGIEMIWTPADPEIYRKIHPVPGSPDSQESTADQYEQAGLALTAANNARKYGLDLMFKLITPDPKKIHPCHLRPPSPRIFILNTPNLEPLIDCIESLKWRPESTTGSHDSPDDVMKVNDHDYDALRYLVADEPTIMAREAVRAKRRTKPSEDGYRGY